MEVSPADAQAFSYSFKPQAELREAWALRRGPAGNGSIAWTVVLEELDQVALLEALEETRTAPPGARLAARVGKRRLRSRTAPVPHRSVDTAAEPTFTENQLQLRLPNPQQADIVLRR